LSPNPEYYAGREQTYIKHLFLSEYLRPAAFKIMRGRDKILNFVDGFAGPWETQDSAGMEDTSFSQSIEVLRGVRDDLRKNGITDAEVRFFFCEKKKASFAKLREFAEQQEGVRIHLFQGRFEDNLDKISEKIDGGFTFTFIDPTGFKIGSQPICHFLRKHRSEFLVNFMADHINRFTEFDDVDNAFAELLADDDWRQRYNKLPSKLSREQRILSLLKEYFKDLAKAKYVPDFAVLKPAHERLQMRLVLGTGSAEGVKLFRDTHKRVELREREVRNEIKLGNQVSLFAPEYLAEVEQAAYGFGCETQRCIASDQILAALSVSGSIEFDDLWPRILESALVTQSDVKDILTGLKRSCAISFDLPPKKKKVQPGTLISLTQNQLLL
jgi:three-Cys-motif partner protein